MANQIPEAFKGLFNKRTFGHLATVMTDGAPQVTPVWVDFDGTYVLVNTARGRVKDKNMQRSAKVAISMTDPDNPYRYLGIRGEIADIAEAGADEHINKLAKRYLDKDVYPFRQPGEVRVIYKVRPTRVWTMGE